MSLLALQNDFQSWLTREPAQLPSSFEPRHRAGLAVYLNNYRSQLLACLLASFPALRTLMGAEAFDAAAAAHIDESPPESWTLDAYADGFPESLRRRFADAPQLAELAALELALATAFVGADAEPVSLAQLADVDWDAAVLHFAPTLTWQRARTNVDAIWSAIGASETPPEAIELAEGRTILVWRAHFLSKFRVASPEECQVIAELQAGASFGSVCAKLVERLGEGPGTAAAGAMLAQWVGDGLLVQISREPSSFT